MAAPAAAVTASLTPESAGVRVRPPSSCIGRRGPRIGSGPTDGEGGSASAPSGEPALGVAARCEDIALIETLCEGARVTVTPDARLPAGSTARYVPAPCARGARDAR